MITALLIFGASFVVVFFMGFQSLVVNSGQVWIAISNSMMIGIMQLFLLKSVPNANSIEEYAAYIFAGPMAVPCAMWVHKKLMKKEKKDE